jgi:glucose-6-phosphate isomerase
MIDETPDRLGPLADATAAALADLRTTEAVARLWSTDHTLWRPERTEISDRLGWLTVVPEMLAELETLRSQCDGLTQDVDHVLVMGMGGSSLFPEVIARSYGRSGGHPQLHVVDTTDPTALARLGEDLPPERTLHVAASKSGTTLETVSQLEWAWARHPDPSRFAVITDPGSELDTLAVERDFAAVWRNRPDIGGRYAALSHFGLVPALLAGADVEEMLATASAIAERLRGAPSVNPGAKLAAVLAAGVRTGRDKVTLVLPEQIGSFGLWLEQLLAESLGKDGTGLIPVVGEPLGDPSVYTDDRLFVVLTDGDEADDADDATAKAQLAQLDDLMAAGHPVCALPFHGLGDIGAQVLLWEVATALCGAILGIQPFDQPDVAAAKAATKEVLAAGTPDDSVAEGTLAKLLESVKPGDYVAIQAFVDPDSDDIDRIEEARISLRDRLHVATTVGLGPRYLHSTGQLHKGGPPTGVFVQIVSETPEQDVEIPGRGYGFGTLIAAQAAGDVATLRDRGRRVARVSIAELVDPDGPT